MVSGSQPLCSGDGPWDCEPFLMEFNVTSHKLKAKQCQATMTKKPIATGESDSSWRPFQPFYPVSGMAELILP